MDFNRTYNAATDDPMNVSRARAASPFFGGAQNYDPATVGQPEPTGTEGSAWKAVGDFASYSDDRAANVAKQAGLATPSTQAPAATPQRPAFGAGGSNPDYGNEGRVARTNINPNPNSVRKPGGLITAENVGSTPANSYDGVANNESMARANAIRQELIDRQPRGGSAVLADQNASWNARMERNRQMDDVTTMMARNPQVAAGIASAFNAQSGTANEGIRGENQVKAEGLRGRNAQQVENTRGQNQLQATGLQAQGRLQEAEQMGINAQALERLRQTSPELASIIDRNRAEAGLKTRQSELLNSKTAYDPNKIFEAIMQNNGDPRIAASYAQALSNPEAMSSLMNKYMNDQAVKRAGGGEIPDPDHLAAMESVAEGRGLDVSGRMVTGAGTETSDSLPAVIDGKHPAALSKHEFVFPEEVVRYFGLNHLNRMIAQARKGLASAPE